MAQTYLGVEKYPWLQPGEERVVIVVEPEHVTSMGRAWGWSHRGWSHDDHASRDGASGNEASLEQGERWLACDHLVPTTHRFGALREAAELIVIHCPEEEAEQVVREIVEEELIVREWAPNEEIDGDWMTGAWLPEITIPVTAAWQLPVSHKRNDAVPRLATWVPAHPGARRLPFPMKTACGAATMEQRRHCRYPL